MKAVRRLRVRFVHWLYDGRPLWLTEALPAQRIAGWTCRLLGHEPIPDHCGRPEHNYCSWCLTPPPNRPKEIA